MRKFDTLGQSHIKISRNIERHSCEVAGGVGAGGGVTTPFAPEVTRGVNKNSRQSVCVILFPYKDIPFLRSMVSLREALRRTQIKFFDKGSFEVRRYSFFSILTCELI